jgi:hypothetical protein
MVKRVQKIWKTELGLKRYNYRKIYIIKEIKNYRVSFILI